MATVKFEGFDEYEMMLAKLGDSTDSVLKQMVQQFEALQGSILAVQEVPAEHTKRSGIVAESFRSLRASLTLHRLNENARTFLFSSSMPTGFSRSHCGLKSGFLKA